MGGFGGLFDLRSTEYIDPILVSTTDGVGTKLIISREANIHKTIGIDLVAMCVNDLIVQGAEPLFFLDYLATGNLDLGTAIEVVDGIAEGCRQARCALIGGETAEMPGMYVRGSYDLAGFAVGAVERASLLPRTDIQPHDLIVGLASNGLHSNGFSLVRVIIKNAGVKLDGIAPFGERQTFAEILLLPTRIYVNSCLSTINNFNIKALAHITGGGLIENIPRVLPDGLGANIFTNSWSLPPIFMWLAKTGNIEPLEMARTFNCGVGMILIVTPDEVDNILAHLTECGEVAKIIGQVTEKSEGEPRVEMHNLAEMFR